MPVDSPIRMSRRIALAGLSALVAGCEVQAAFAAAGAAMA
jgi:hypothetical protein